MRERYKLAEVLQRLFYSFRFSFGMPMYNAVLLVTARLPADWGRHLDIVPAD